ncbi:hypothetical protein EYF80_056582 [Liparis tanakae]|uniref:Uncharacterized protein n=1 Tax=Liparis tanakae TaxID=230148 RepID=A0A4Z2EWR7_9TELE|nr:hypothetical protein EYF80_056582 [Liparis tanakae]
MDVSALLAVTLLLGALVALVALALGRRREEMREESEQAAGTAGKTRSHGAHWHGVCVAA